MVCLYSFCFSSKSVNFRNGFAYCVGPGRAHAGPYGPIWAPYGPIWAHMVPYGPEKSKKIRKNIAFIGAFKGPCTLPPLPPLYIPYIFHICFPNMFHMFSLVCFLIYSIIPFQILFFRLAFLSFL